jgi:hypothetical protein
MSTAAQRAATKGGHKWHRLIEQTKSACGRTVVPDPAPWDPQNSYACEECKAGDVIEDHIERLEGSFAGSACGA